MIQARLDFMPKQPMNILYTNMEELSGPNIVILVTTNQVVKSNGHLVMGAGAAKWAAQKWPQLPLLAAAVRDKCTPIIQTKNGTQIGIFPTKKHWQENSSLEMIAKSSQELKELALAHPELEYHVNFPGIGFGHLNFGDVQNTLEAAEFPENVYFHILKRVD